jgi:hypothetical protein
MSKSKQTKKAPAPKSGRKGGVGGSTPPVEKPTKEEDLVVFAFRLTPAERDLIHKAAGPAKASKYVRTLAVAAANGDEALVLQLLGGPAPADEGASA